MKQLRRVRELTALTLLATDGEIGHVQEVYFDDRNWAVRYLVVKTGRWLLSREVLLAPAAVAEISDADGAIRVGLTKEQIRRAPPIEAAKPLSREYEEAYFRHFQWAPYWEPGPSEWASAVPFPETPPVPIDTTLPADAPKNPHLRSSSEIAGYDIQASNGAVGHLEDLVVDDETWTVRYLEVDTRNWLPGKKVLLQTVRIDHISWAERSVAVVLRKEAIESAPPYDPSKLITPGYEVQLFKHYGTQAA
ncbi:MAG TPA: PRC-barrel domain-containing protein [Nitrospira sp.]|nr:PRC-barrel domain-containing protein [Nitrospira sp.]